MAQVKDVTVPDIGDFTDVPIVEVLVSAGDEVAADDPLVVLESDKASMEVPAPEAGGVKEVKVSVGDTVSEGTVVLTLEPAGAGSDGGDDDDDEKAEEPAEEEKPEPSDDDAEEAEEAEPSADTGKSEEAAETEVATAMPGEEDTPAHKTTDEPPAQPKAGSGSAAGREAASDSPAESSNDDSEGDAPAYASPSVRRRARELGVDLSSVSGSGRKGRITLEDLEKEPEEKSSDAPAKPAAPSGDEERVELTKIQKLSKKSLTRSWQEIPHVTQHEDADITELEAFRKQLNAEQDDVKVTMVALLLKASSATLDAFPRFA